MAEFSREDDIWSILTEELFGLSESLGGKGISLEDVFETGFRRMPGTPDLNPLMPVQVEEDSALILTSEETMRSREQRIPVTGSITAFSVDRRNSKTVTGSGQRKRIAADETVSDSDSEDVESVCSGAGSEETCVKFAEQFLSYGIRCKPSFWQYNQELRGPKAKRLLSALDEGDFHILSGCIDPASDSKSNKAKHDKGNDLRPDPLKLLSIGSRISAMEELFKSADGMVSGKRKKAIGQEKNKLASRICRLRKKAQHEANKIKLEGLQKEQSQLIRVSLGMLDVMHDHIVQSAVQPNAGHSDASLCVLLKALISQHLGFMVADHTVEYVNRELETVAKQVLAGGRTGEGQSDGGG